MTTATMNQKGGGRGGGLKFLPDDLILEVMSRLPVKSLLRFNCVSKQFLDLISSQSLRKLHQYHSHRTPKQLLLRLFKSPTVTTLCVSILVDDKSHTKFDLTESVHSEICFSCHGLMLFSDSLAENIHVCNPSTHELIELPKSPRSFASSWPRLWIAMGFLHESNTYKILVLRLNEINDRNYEFNVCTLKDGGFTSWSSANHHLNSEGRSLFLEDCVSIDGVVYWMTLQMGSLMFLLVFDFRTQDFAVIHGPTYHDPFSATHLAELRGRLCVVGTRWENGHRITIIWVQRCRNEWEKMWEIGETFLYRVLACVPASAAINQENHQRVDGQEEEDYDIVYTHYREVDLHYYNTKNKSLKRTSKPCRLRSDGHWSEEAFVYDDTLFSLNPLADLQGE